MAGKRTAFAGVVLENQKSVVDQPSEGRIRVAAGTSMEEASKFLAGAFKNLANKANTVEVAVDPSDPSKGTKKVTFTTVDGILNLR